MKYDAVILDLDGTLLNTLPDIRGIVNTVTGNIGMAPFSEARIRAAVGSGVEILLERLGVPQYLNAALADEISSEYARIHDSSAFLYPGVEEMLDSLFQQVLNVCILSNKPTQGVFHSVKTHLSKYPFKKVIGSVPGLPAKPEPDAMLQMLGELGVKPSKALMVGDGEADFMVAEASGTGHISVLWGYRSRTELTAIGAAEFAEVPHDVLRFAELLP